MIRATLLVCATFFSTFAYAQVIPVNSHQQVIDIAMQNYWGKARLQDGSTFQPNHAKHWTLLNIR